MEKEIRGKYQWIEWVGDGGGGRVHKVLDNHLQCFVAIKEMDGASDLSQNELSILKELRHPALPAVMDFFVEDGKAFLVMEFIEGMTLAQYLEKNGRIQQEKAVQWGIALGQVLQYLHERKQPIIYRDMKPANVMVDPDGKLWLIDFGTAYCRYKEQENGHIKAGTFGYAAPEQFDARSFDLVDERSDIYGLGATICHMITGNDPTKPPYMLFPIREFDKALSKGLEGCLGKATMKQKDKRQKNMEIFINELKNYRKKDQRRKQGLLILNFIFYSILLFLAFLFYILVREVEYYGKTEDKGSVLLLGFLILFISVIKSAVIEKISAGREESKIRGKSISRIKNYYLTEKKGMGLVVFLVLICCLTMLPKGTSVMAKAKEERDKNGQYLEVIVRDDNPGKRLIRYDVVYALEQDFKMEIPIHIFEEEKIYYLTVTCREKGETKGKERSFYLQRKVPLP